MCSEQREDGQRPTDHRQTVEADLYRVHLPALATADVVEFESRRGHVRYLDCPLVSDLLSIVDDPGSVDCHPGQSVPDWGLFDRGRPGRGGRRAVISTDLEVEAVVGP